MRVSNDEEAGNGRAPSPTPSVSSVASSRSGTLSRPPPPPKPSYLASTFTGTVNSVALREYIQAQKTGGSFTSESRAGTISQAFAGYGYGSVDHFVDAFESSDDDAAVIDQGDRDADIGTARPTMRKRTYTAPSVSRVFNPSAEDDLGDGTTKLLRKEPIQIDGKGPSRVGNLRNMFESPSAASAAPLAPQLTGTTLSRGKAKKVSEKTRMLQAQITGETGVWSFSQGSAAASHQLEASDASEKYQTAKQDQVERDLKKLSMIMDDGEAQGTVRLSPGRTLASPDSATTHRTASVDSSPAAHDRDDSSATIRPRNISPHLNSSRRMPSTLCTSIADRRSRLSSVFSAGSDGNGDGSPSAQQSSPSPDSKSVAGSDYAETDAGRNERSREPSMLIDSQTVKTSAHMRARDGSAFDFDWVSRAQGTERRQASQVEGFGAATDGAAVSLSDSSSQHVSSAIAPVAVRAGPPPQRPDSIVLTLEAQVEDASVSPSLCPVTEEHDQPSQDHDERLLAGGAPAVVMGAEDVSMLRLPQPGIGREARALYDFLGEASFNELSLKAGQSFEILNEELAGGWSLGVVWDEDGIPRRGLIPRGWYCYIQDFTMSPPAAQGVEPPPTPSPFPEEDEGHDTEDTAKSEFLGHESPSLQRSKSDTGAKGTAKSQSPTLGSKTMSRVGSLRAASNPLSSLSSAKADGDTWRQSRAPGTGRSLQALETLASVAADHGISMPTDHGSTHTDQERDESEGRELVAEATDSNDSYHIRHSTSSAQAHEAQHTEPSMSTPARPVAASGVPASRTEPPPPSAMFGWRGSIFGGKTFNRFASFVTSGAEEYILSKDAGSLGSDHLRTMTRPTPSFSTASNASDRTEATSVDGYDAMRSREASSSSSAGSVKPDDADQHFIVAGRAGPKWKAKTPPFLVQVHSPEKRTKMSGMHEYTVFCVTSTFPALATEGGETPAAAGAAPHHSASWEVDENETVLMPYDPIEAPDPPGPSLTVFRRFTQFAWLFQTLTKLYPALVIPPMPEKQYSGRFAADFIETRRADLELWLSRIVRHPVLRYSEALLFFLSCDDDIEWKRKAGRLLRGEGREGGGTPGSGKPKGNMFARTWHPSFNFDSVEATLEGEAVDAHLRAMERTMNGVGGPNVGRAGVLGAWKGLREGAVSTSACYRELSYSLLRLITGAGVIDADGGANGDMALPAGTSVGSGEYAHYLHGPPMGNLGKRSDSGATNEHGVWCWREGCHECTNLTYVLQNTAEAMQDVADIFEDHARDTLLRQHERLKDISRPHTAHQSLLETHRATLAKYREATGEPDPLDPKAEEHDADLSSVSASTALTPQESERIAARCETVLNVTLAEMGRVHDERVEDLHSIGKRFLDSQIDIYETILETLKSARAHYDEEYYDCERGTHILSSRYQGDLLKPRRMDRPLAMPSAALGGVGGLGKMGMLLSSAAGMTRPVSGGFMNGAVEGLDRADRSTSSAPGGSGTALGGSFFLFPNSYSPGVASAAGTATIHEERSAYQSGTITATSTLKASQQQQQQQQQQHGVNRAGGGNSRTSYFSLWK